MRERFESPIISNTSSFHEELDMQTFNPFRLSRRSFLQYAACALTLSAASALSPASALAAAGENRVLILYFSRSGNTRALAEHIHSRVGGDMVELKPAVPYPADYDSVVDMAKKEQEADARPKLGTEIPDLDRYDTVFLGFPNWWGTMPMLFFTLLEEHPLGQKTVVPFCTHGGSRFGRSVQDLRRLCPEARLLEGFEIRGTRSGGAQSDVDAWLRSIGLLPA